MSGERAGRVAVELDGRALPAGPPTGGAAAGGRVEFTVVGSPSSQGSMSFYGKGRVSHGRPAHARALTAWRAAVAAAGREAMVAAGLPPFHGPVGVELRFVLERPLHHHRGRRRSHPVRDDAPEFSHSKPDLDKLVRAAIDAITMAEVVWGDDAQVAEVRAFKRYGEPGARVAVWPLADPAVVTLDVDLGEEEDAP